MSWTLVPIGKAVLMLHPEVPTNEQLKQSRDMVSMLMKITGVPWIVMFSAELADEKTVKEIAERYFGIKR